jgi:ABC-2 type transport system permease protein
MNLRLMLLHSKAQVVQYLRAPGYIVSALLSPPLFFLFFGIPEVRNGIEANLALASYSTYVFTGIAFYQFTGAVAQGRQAAWDAYLRTLPAKYIYRLAGWALSSLVIAILGLVLLTTIALLTIDVGAPPLYWTSLGFALVCGSVPMALIAATIGYWASPTSAFPIAAMIYYSLTYAGGIWTSPESLPSWLQEVSPFLPSRLWGEIAWASVEGNAWQTVHWLGLVGYTLLFGILAVWGYRRENWRRYG